VPDGLRILSGFNPALNYFFNRADREQFRAMEARLARDRREQEASQAAIDQLADPFRNLPPDLRPPTFRNTASYYGDTMGYFPQPPLVRPRR
jgi:hypothetical protein